MQTSLLSHRPALRIVLLVAAGILLARMTDVPAGVAAALAAGLLLGSVLLGRFRGRSRTSAAALQLALVMSGSALQTFQHQDALRLRLQPEAEPEWISFRGVVLDAPMVREGGATLTVRADDLRTNLRQISGQRTLSVRLGAGGPPGGGVVPGTAVRMSGRLDRFPARRNPGDTDPGKFYELRGLHGVVLAEAGDVVIDPIEDSYSLRVAAARVRDVLGGIIDRLHGTDQAAFLRGILLGDRAGIEPSVKQSFVATGTMHILAVSGLHVGIIAVVAYVLMGLLRLPRAGAAGATMVVLVFYMLLTGLSPSVVRATVMACVVLAARFVERRVDLYQSLGLAALLILAYDSNQLFHPGFQLSFAAVFSIAYFYPGIVAFLRRPLGRGSLGRRVDPVVQLLAVSLAAQIGTVPFVAQYFEQVSLVGLAVNLVVVPLMSVNVTLGFVTLMTASVLGWLGSVFAGTNDLLVRLLLEVVDFGSRAPMASVSTASLSWLFPAIYYPSVLAVAHVSDARRFRRLLLLVLLIGTIGLAKAAAEGTDHSVNVTVIDVGQGDAILIETPYGRRMLIDAGPGGFDFSAGERFIEPLLRRRGIQRLDAVVMTHPHADHIGGIPHLLENVEIGRIITSGQEALSRTYQDVVRLAHERGVPVDTVGAGDTLMLDPTLRIYVLYPRVHRDRARNANDMSLVLKIQHGGNAFLFPGDAEDDVEDRLRARYGAFLQSNVLKVGHHGSATSSSPAFLDAVQPGIALISVGHRNKFRHPSSTVTGALEKRSVLTQRTDRQGALIVSSDGQRVRLLEWNDIAPHATRARQNP